MLKSLKIKDSTTKALSHSTLLGSQRLVSTYSVLFSPLVHTEDMWHSIFLIDATAARRKNIALYAQKTRELLVNVLQVVTKDFTFDT